MRKVSMRGTPDTDMKANIQNLCEAVNSLIDSNEAKDKAITDLKTRIEKLEANK